MVFPVAGIVLLAVMYAAHRRDGLFCGAGCRRRQSGFDHNRDGSDFTLMNLQHWGHADNSMSGLISILESLSPQDGIFVDVGAHHGEEMQEAAKRGYTVRSYDINSANVEYIKTKVVPKLPTGSGDVTVQLKGISNYTEEGHDVVIRGSSAWSGINPTGAVDRAATVNKLPIVRLDDEIGNTGTVAVLKTDTQGNEYEVLQGAEALLNSHRIKCIVLELDLRLNDVVHRGQMGRSGKVVQPDPYTVGMLQFLYRRGYRCGDLMWLSKEQGHFEQRVARPANIYQFLIAMDDRAWTDLACCASPSLSEMDARWWSTHSIKGAAGELGPV